MNLMRRQELFLDGIETSLEMARICYSRLYHDIEQYSQQNQTKDAPENLQNLILLDAWSFIDIINRVRILVSQATGLKKNTLLASYQRVFENVETLRHFVQHINSEIPKIEDKGWPIWGSISWIFVSPDIQKRKQVKSMVIVPGRLAKVKGLPVINPAGKKIHSAVDHISLSIGEITINLSDIFRTSMLFRKHFESAVLRAKDIHDSKDEILQIDLKQ